MPVTQAEKEAMDRELADAHSAIIAPKSYTTPIAPVSPISVNVATGRGLVNGLFLGFQPQLAGGIASINPFTKNNYAQEKDEAERLNQEAWTQNPIAYGSGYTLGTLGNVAATGPLLGILGKAGTAIKGAGAAVDAAEAAGAAPTLARVLPKSGEQAVKAIEAIKGAGTKTIPESVKRVAPNVIRGTTELNNFESNTPSGQSMLPFGTYGSADQADTEETNTFARLQQYLNQAPDEESKRKLAMELNSTPEGRAMMGNQES